MKTLSTSNITDEGFASRLKEAMQGAGIKNQSELAGKLAVSQGAVSGWLNGTIPQKRLLYDLASLVKRSPQWLRTGQDPRESEFVENLNRPRDEDPDDPIRQEIRRQLNEGPSGWASRAKTTELWEEIETWLTWAASDNTIMRISAVENLRAFLAELRKRRKE